MEGGRWEAALLRGEAVLPWFKQYYGKNTGIVASLLLRFGKLIVFLRTLVTIDINNTHNDRTKSPVVSFGIKVI